MLNLSSITSLPNELDFRSNRSSRASSEFPKDQFADEDSFPLVCKKTQYIICIGDDRSTYKYRIRTYATLYKMMNYIDSYLKEVPIFQRISYTHPYFKNYMQTVYSISLRL
ncbi:hypothetical protein CJF32_00011223 [Rutstroemia sp. NJR-2017a WRK4]|nr:hypothetical protein CJF32_00011223 [Rutstroemia sp. NJR-2017a WRK4]